MAIKIHVAECSSFLGLRTDTTPAKCPANYSPDCGDLIFAPNSLATRPPFNTILIPLPTEIVWRKEFTCKDGSEQILALDINGVLYAVHADGSYDAIDTVAPSSSVSSVTAYGREYMSFLNPSGGCDAPRKWDGKTISRVSQGGPGAGPSFSPVALTGDSYALTSITQPPPQTWGSAYFLQSMGPGNSSAGTVGTVYYADSTVSVGDADLIAAFNSGFSVYVYMEFSGTPVEQGPYTVLVTSIGLAQPPGQPRSFYYYTYELTTSAFTYYQGSGHPGYTANFQRTIATIQAAETIPGVAVGNNLTITGSSIAAYNGTITVAQTPDSGEMVITQTSLVGGVATYSYSLQTGVAPANGQTITITGTLNAGGILNVTDGVISGASGGPTGSFAIGGFLGPDFAPAAESGDGITAGTEFLFDPGIAAVGTSNSPIYGNAVGGFAVFAGTATLIASGKRSGVVFFITDEDFTTAPSPIVNFTVPANTSAIRVDNLPIGPPNVIARGVAFTGANGGNFFFMDIPPQVNGTVSGTATVVNDNTSTSATFNFADLSLFGGIAIDIPGNNLFQQVALNLPRGVRWYQNRLFWIGEKNTVIGLLNMGMDGGTLSGSSVPLGWTNLGVGSIIQQGSMPAYQVTGPDTGEIVQGFAQTSAFAAIAQPNLNYSLRFWMLGSGAKIGTLVATISSVTAAFSSTATYDLSTLTQSGYNTINFSEAMPNTIPSDLLIGIKFVGVVGVVTTRDYQLIYADNPNRNPIARASYVQNPEAYDAETGNIGPADDNTELRALFVLQESFYFITERRLYAVEQIGNSEPSSWDPYQVSDKCGAFHAESVTTGKGWAAWGGSDGAFWYGGGLPTKPSAIITPTWNQFTSMTNMLDDSSAERVYFGMLAADGSKKILVYDYHEVNLGGSGKWCPWNRPLNWISESTNGPVFCFGSKFYELSDEEGVEDDDLGLIGGYNTFPPFGLSPFQKDHASLFLRIAGSGPLTPFLYGKKLTMLTQALMSQELSTLIDEVAEWPMNIRSRNLFLKVGQPGAQFTLEDVSAIYQNDPNSPISGVR